MTYLPPPDLQNQQYYIHEYRESKKGFKHPRRMPWVGDPLFLIITLVRLFVALGRSVFDIARWLIRTVQGKR